jgi:glutathione synthase/RimK-type ligase-like ATP-grasp enzyme
MKKIGILRGMESSFPEALISYINTKYAGKNVEASFVSIDTLNMNDDCPYDVIIDRISHEVSFYRSFLKWASIKGSYIINNPFWWSADDKFIDNIIAENVGVAVPKTAILPHKEHPPNTRANSFRNLKYPIDWERTFSYIGFPAYLKPHDGGGWRGVSKVHTPEEFFHAYDQSGTDCMMLQEDIDFESYYRCYCIGRKDVHVMPYNPRAEHHLRYASVRDQVVPSQLKKQISKDVLALCTALGYDMNTVEFAVRDGIPYAIDFMNPAPDADYDSVGPENFEWIVKAMGKFAVAKALEKRAPMPVFGPSKALDKNAG